MPDFDFNYGLGDRIQLKYEIPIAIEETRAGYGEPGTVIGGLGESLLGIKWRFYEHHAGEARFAGRFGTGLLGAFRQAATEPAAAAGDSPGAQDSAEQRVDLSVSTYPQLTLDNPTRAVPRGLVEPGPDFFLPLEVNGRIGPLRFDGEVGYSFGNKAVAQRWNRGLLVGHEFGDRTEAYLEVFDEQDANRVRGEGAKQRETTLGFGGRQAMNRAKTLNLLLMGGRSFQKPSAANGQPGWIASVGLQVLLGGK